MSLKVRTDSVEATRRVAAALAPLLHAGDVLLLSGDLGGGKTAFVQGLAAAMGIADPVTSPTFTLAHTYTGRLKLHHLDAYRLEKPDDIVDLNLPELLNDSAVVAIEWGERVLAEIPSDYLAIRFNLGDVDQLPDVRILEFEAAGPSWQSRTPAIALALEPLGADV